MTRKTLLSLLLASFAVLLNGKPVNSMLGSQCLEVSSESESEPSPVPSDYIEVEYLRSEGATQQILLGSVYLPSVEFELLASATNIQNGNDRYFIGADSGGTRRGGVRLAQYGKVNFNGTSQVITSRTISNAEAILIKYLEGYASVSGYLAATSWNWDAYTANLRLYASAGNRLDCSIYRAIVWVSGELKWDLYPCVRKSDNKPGFYNAVDGGFLTNNGTGEFAVGPEKH